MIPPLLEAVLQAVIVATGCAAIWMIADDRPFMRWGFVVGMLGQPAWLISTWMHGQFGMFVVSVFFTIAYGRGIWTHWIKPRLRARRIAKLNRAYAWRPASSATARDI